MLTFRPFVLTAPAARAACSVALAALLGLVMLAGFAAGTASVLISQGVRGLCATEDSPSCVWIAPLQGNHRGHPVIVVNGPER